VQYCQQLTPEVIWKDAYVRHPNGVTGLAAVYVVADDPAAAAARWGRFSGLLPRAQDRFVCLQAARGKILLGRKADMPGNAPDAPALAGYALSCRDPHAFLARCRGAGIAVRGQTVLLPPALGGWWLVHGEPV
jgi:hypothetical protein